MPEISIFEFLLARTAEAEQAEKQKISHNKAIEFVLAAMDAPHQQDTDPVSRVSAMLELQINRQTSVRALEQCAAIRRIVAVASKVMSAEPARPDRKPFDFVIRELAAPFADHPDFRAEWLRRSITAQLPEPREQPMPAHPPSIGRAPLTPSS